MVGNCSQPFFIYNAMGKKLTKEEFEERVKIKSNDTIDVSEFNFINTQKEGKCVCKICGNVWYPKAYSILQGHGCRKCYDKRNSDNRKIDLSKIQERIDKTTSNAHIIGDYIDTKHKCLAQCDKCGNIWEAMPSDLLRGHSCPKCGREESSENERITNKEYIDRCYSIYGDEYDLSELNYTIMRDDVYPICKKHGKFSINAYQFLKGNGCKKCRMSGGQRKLSKFLKDNGIIFYEEYNKFDWLTRKNSGRMSFDFFIPSLNIAIEYQGKQHFEKVDRFGGEEGLRLTKERDAYKRDICRENGVKLIYFIPYKYEKYMTFEDIYFTENNKLLEYLKYDE